MAGFRAGSATALACCPAAACAPDTACAGCSVAGVTCLHPQSECNCKASSQMSVRIHKFDTWNPGDEQFEPC